MPIYLNYAAETLLYAAIYIFSLIYMSNLLFMFNFSYLFLFNAIVGFYFCMIVQQKNKYHGDISLIIMMLFTLCHSAFFLMNFYVMFISNNKF